MQNGPPLKKLKTTGRFIAPHLLLALFFLFNLISLPIPYSEPANPYLVLIYIYYWSIHRPTIVPPLLCFFLGILMDILSGVPIGLNAFILVGVQWLVRDQRRFLTGQPYITIWAVFGLVAIACGAWQWGLLGVIQTNWASPISGLISIAMSLFIFPFASLLLNFIHRMLPVASHSFP